MGVNRLVRDFRIFSPIRYQTPSQRVQGALAGFRIGPYRENILCPNAVPEPLSRSLSRSPLLVIFPRFVSVHDTDKFQAFLGAKDRHK